METTDTFAALLRSHGFRATEARMELLRLLARADRPISPAELVRRIGTRANQATIYRSLEAFSDAGLVRRVNMEHQHAHYEFSTSGTEHHHHIICRTCGLVEHVDGCAISDRSPTLLRHSKQFRRIESHALEFFGTCTACTTKTSSVPVGRAKRFVGAKKTLTH